MSKAKLISEFFQYIKESKKLWLIPLLILLFLIAVVVVLSHSQVIAPFLYALF